MHFLRRLFFILVPVILLTVSCGHKHHSSAASSPHLTVHFFGSSTCEECHQIQTTLLAALNHEHPDSLRIVIHDIESDSGFSLALAMEKRYGVKKPSPQELYLPDTFLTGYKDIMKMGRRMIEQRLQNPELYGSRQLADSVTGSPGNLNSAIKEKLDAFSFFPLFAAGFLDGINPCAIATMIFLISFLGTQKRKRSDVLKIGLAFSGTVFVTYLSIGLGAFRILTLLDQFFWLSLGINLFAIGLSVWVAAFSIRDAIVYYRTHDAAAMKVQLPRPIKLLIHSVIKDNLSSNKIVVGAIVTGFLVTLLAGVCTAKIYLPTIVLMTRAVGFRLLGWILLLFYNFLFVLPLLIVMIAAAYGLKWTKVSKFTQNHLALVKVLLALVLFALATYISIHTVTPQFMSTLRGMLHLR
jgi:hypothetical protein